MSFKFNPFTGHLDRVVSSTIAVDSATKLKITRIAQEQIFSEEVVRAFSSTQVSLATADNVSTDAMALGIAENDANIGETVDVVLLGVATNTSFSVFTVNDALFLDVDGGITNVKRTSGFHTVVGKALGSNDILFQSENPVTIA